VIASPRFAARINLKPLNTADALSRVDPAWVLKSLQKEIMKSVRARLLTADFSKRARDALARGLRVKIGPNSLTVYATHPAFLPLVKGRDPGQMTWLRGARAPIPIVLDSGEVIFRSATARSMKNGRWIHPGHRPTTILEQARQEARAIVKKRVKKEIQRQLRAGLKAVR